VTSGSIKFDGEDVTDQPPQERNTVMMFQDLALWEHMTVRENIGYGLKIKDVDRETIKEKTENAAKQLKITDKLDQKPGQLSGGQQQRVAIARAIVQEPDLFLLDEPLSDLDAALKQEIQPLMERIIAEADVPAIYVTHDQSEAMTLSDKIAVMNDGTVQQFDDPTAVYDSPVNKFVAEFIGMPPMNFIDITKAGARVNGQIDLSGIKIDLPDDETQPEEIGVRPQAIQVRTDSPTGISAKHVLDQPLGDRTVSYFDTEFKDPEDEDPDITVVTEPDFEGGQKQYNLVFDPSEVYMFDS
jgi:multiple sugar transport system ATP-binding protein